MKIKFFKGIRKYHDTEMCLGISIVYDKGVSTEGYLFGISLYIELIWWEVWFELDFLK